MPSTLTARRARRARLYAEGRCVECREPHHNVKIAGNHRRVPTKVCAACQRDRVTLRQASRRRAREETVRTP